MAKGTLAFLLHAHLPFVRHPEHEDFLEEDWFFEAVAETYLPLLGILRRMASDRVPARLTMTFTPTLCAMLRDPLLISRAERYLERGIEMARGELERTATDAQRNTLAAFYLARFTAARDLFVGGLNRDILGAYAQLQEEGLIEIITCAATHGFLPLMEAFPGALRAQILIGRDDYVSCFGRPPAGIWLPECGYVPAVDRVLQEAEIRWFVVDAHGLMFGQPRPRLAIYAPYFTPAGPAAFGRDRDSSKQVWSAREGYPGDPAYRDFYRDLGQEAPPEVMRAVYGDGVPRRNTGIKYHRITGQGREKELYVRGWAEGAVEAHASDFVRSRVAQFEHLGSVLPVDPIVLSPFDAELFGHWWFEGPEFLDLFIRKAAYDQSAFKLDTPTAFLEGHPTQQIVAPAPSSWGNKGYWEVWLDRTNAWIYPHLHAAARRMTEAAVKFRGSATPGEDRVLKQMVRELLLAQSSDWAFLMKTGTAREYATRRTKDHVLRFNRLHDDLARGATDAGFLGFCETRDNLFPDLDWRYYA